MKKRFLALFLTVILSFGAAFVTPVSASSVRGDINFDSNIDLIDLLLLRKYISKLIELSDEQLISADCDGDQTVATNDILTLRKYLVKSGELYKDPSWTTIYDWETETVDARPTKVTIVPSTIAVASRLDGYGNRKNLESKQALAVKAKANLRIQYYR